MISLLLPHMTIKLRGSYGQRVKKGRPITQEPSNLEGLEAIDNGRQEDGRKTSKENADRAPVWIEPQRPLLVGLRLVVSKKSIGDNSAYAVQLERLVE